MNDTNVTALKAEVEGDESRETKRQAEYRRLIAERPPAPKRDLVTFLSSFRSNATPLDGARTLCGRRLVEWISEGWHEDGPDCLVCARSLAKREAIR